MNCGRGGKKNTYSTKYHDTETDLYYYGRRYYLPETSRWLNRDPLGERGGLNLYGFVNNNSINFFDVLGFYTYDMHFAATYAALRAAGKAPKTAWNLAYYSAIPDINKQYDAIGDKYGPGANWAKSLFGDEVARGYQKYLHMLNGLRKDQIEKVRECLHCKFKSKGISDAMRGVLLHALGDSYGHLQATYTYDLDESGMPTGPIEYGVGDSTYSAPLGHAPTTDADVAAYRKDLAKDYLSDVYHTFGGTDSGALNAVLSTVESLPRKNTNKASTEASYAEFHKWMEDDLKYLSSEQLGYNPLKNEHELFQGQTINASEMLIVIDMIKGCVEASK